MKRLTVAAVLLRLVLSGLVFGGLVLGALAPVASADSSHARIVRLSLLQGDVRFTPDAHKDALADDKASWEVASLNLPIRQGYSLATDNGRAEVEFENGAMAFLGPNTVIEFYDLSLRDGARITRLVLRQGSASFYVHPATGDYFSVTGGDFTVEASQRATFRLDNFDDGSKVNILQGHAAVLRNEHSTPLDKGQSLSVQAGSSGEPAIGRVEGNDEFDQWVSGRVESVVTATNYSNQYVNSPNYSSGFGDLYTYGSWYSVGGYGNCWRPFGAGFGWSPFSYGYGNWFYDPFFGWSFIGSAPWGWLPYHYGGWIFSPVYGWVWAPTGFGGGYGGLRYRPVTAVWIHNGATTGIVPLHPADTHGKTPLNIAQGVYPVQSGSVAKSTMMVGSEKWSVVKNAPKETLSSGLAAASAPTRVSRSITEANAGNRGAVVSHGSTITFDAGEHRFVNSSNAGGAVVTGGVVNDRVAAREENGAASAKPAEPASASIGATAHTTVVPGAVPGAPRTATPPRPSITPPPARTSGGSSGSSGGGHTFWGGTHSSSGSSHSSTSSGSSGGGSHASAGGGSSHSSGGGGGHR